MGCYTEAVEDAIWASKAAWPFFVILLQDTKHNNIVDNYGICDRIKTAKEEIKFFIVYGYCIFSISSISMTYRENYSINMLHFSIESSRRAT